MFLMETVNIPLFICKQRNIQTRLPQQLPILRLWESKYKLIYIWSEPSQSEILVTNATGELAYFPGFASELKELHPVNKHTPQSLIRLSFVEDQKLVLSLNIN